MKHRFLHGAAIRRQTGLAAKVFYLEAKEVQPHNVARCGGGACGVQVAINEGAICGAACEVQHKAVVLCRVEDILWRELVHAVFLDAAAQLRQSHGAARIGSGRVVGEQGGHKAIHYYVTANVHLQHAIQKGLQGFPLLFRRARCGRTNEIAGVGESEVWEIAVIAVRAAGKVGFGKAKANTGNGKSVLLIQLDFAGDWGINPFAHGKGIGGRSWVKVLPDTENVRHVFVPGFHRVHGNAFLLGQLANDSLEVKALYIWRNDRRHVFL